MNRKQFYAGLIGICSLTACNSGLNSTKAKGGAVNSFNDNLNIVRQYDNIGHVIDSAVYEGDRIDFGVGNDQQTPGKVTVRDTSGKLHTWLGGIISSKPVRP